MTERAHERANISSAARVDGSGCSPKCDAATGAGQRSEAARKEVEGIEHSSLPQPLETAILLPVSEFDYLDSSCKWNHTYHFVCAYHFVCDLFLSAQCPKSLSML